MSINGVRSAPRLVLAGVSQGARLSPSYFNIYSHDLPVPRDGEVAQLADDTAFLATSFRTDTITRRLQRASNSFTRYFRRWRVRVNSSKSKAVLFTRKTANRHRPTTRIKVDGREIEWVNDLVYLGLTLDKRLTFGDHVTSVISKSDRTIKSLYSLVGRNARLNALNKIFLFKTVIRPGFSYAAPVWYECALSHRRRLQVFQNKTLKMMLNKPRRFPTTTLHSIAGVETIQEHLDKLWLNFGNNCSNNINDDIVSLISVPL